MKKHLISLGIIIIGLSIINHKSASGYDICITGDTNTNNIEFQKEQEVFVNAWVKVENAPAYNCYDDPEGVVRKRLLLRSRYRVIANNYSYRYRKNDKSERWSLLVKGSEDKVEKENIVGWVSDENLMFTRYPLKNLKTAIYEKALIREGDMNTKHGGGTALRIYKEPELRNAEEKGIEVRTVFYVYDYYPHSAGSPQSQETKSLLISPIPKLDFYQDIEPLLIGWIDRSKVTFWNTRIGSEFRIGGTVEFMPDQGSVIFNRNNRSLPYDSLRNPILEEEGDFYRVGAFARLDTRQLLIRKKLEKVTTGLEVLFVVDGTRSMTRAFRDTLRGVENVADSLKYQSTKEGLEQPRFGIVFYRDIATITPVMIRNGEQVRTDHPDCRKETTVYPMSNIKKFKNILEQEIACDSDTTGPESVYLGLVNGIEKAEFQKGKAGKTTRVRVIIHIGDAGDNNRGNLTENKVLSKLREEHIYSYIAIDVSGRNSSRFEVSLRPIVNLFGRNAAFIKNPDNLSESVSMTLMNFLSEAKKTKNQIEIISRGFAGTNEGSAGVFSQEILDLAKEIIEANNIDLTDYDAFQYYVEGKVKKTAPMDKYVLVSKTNIENITSFLSRLIDTASSENKKIVWEGLLKLILGDQTCTDFYGKELTIEECNKMNNGIPIKAGFMKYTKSQFLNLSYKETKDIICEAKVARERFRYLIADKKVERIQFTNKDMCEFEVIPTLDLNGDGLVVKDGLVHRETSAGKLELVRDARDVDLIDKYFFIEGGESMAWIPLSHLGETE